MTKITKGTLTLIPASIDKFFSAALTRIGKTVLWLLTPVIGVIAVGYLVSRVSSFELDSFVLSKLIEWSIVLAVVALLTRFSKKSRLYGLNWPSKLHRLTAFLAGYFIILMAVFGFFALFFGTGPGPLISLDDIVIFFNKPLLFALEIILLFMVLFVAPPRLKSNESDTI